MDKADKHDTATFNRIIKIRLLGLRPIVLRTQDCAKFKGFVYYLCDPSVSLCLCGELVFAFIRVHSRLILPDFL